MQSLNPEAPAAVGYFERNQQAFQKATARTKAVKRAYKIGTHIIQMEFAGNALVPRLIRSIAHLETEDHRFALSNGLYLGFGIHGCSIASGSVEC